MKLKYLKTPKVKNFENPKNEFSFEMCLYSTRAIGGPDKGLNMVGPDSFDLQGTSAAASLFCAGHTFSIGFVAACIFASPGAIGAIGGAGGQV